MKEVMIDIKCHCNFWVQHILYTNEYGYFVFPEAYCPKCLCKLNVGAFGTIKDVVEVEHDNKRRS